MDSTSFHAVIMLLPLFPAWNGSVYSGTRSTPMRSAKARASSHWSGENSRGSVNCSGVSLLSILPSPVRSQEDEISSNEFEKRVRKLSVRTFSSPFSALEMFGCVEFIAFATSVCVDITPLYFR